jgi:hypothetical protein
MEIVLSEDEYKNLLEMLYIAEWVMNAHNVDPDPSTIQYTTLEQKILSLAKEFGYNELVDYESKFGEYFLSRKIEEGSIKNIIEEYDNETFWNELIDRLVDRDMIRNNSEEDLKMMTIEERLEKEAPLRTKYETEFEDNGIENISIN